MEGRETVFHRPSRFVGVLPDCKKPSAGLSSKGGNHRLADGPALRNAMENKTASTASRAILASLLIGSIVAGYLTIHSRARSLSRPIRLEGLASTQALLCGRPDDRLVHVPSNWTTFLPPKTGQSYIDPVFGCKVTRLTDSSSEEELANGTHPSLLHQYSTLSPINANDTMLLITSNDGAWRIKGINGGVVVSARKMPAMNNGHPMWDASDGNVFYYTLGKTLHKAAIAGGSVKSTVVQTFKEYS